MSNGSEVCLGCVERLRLAEALKGFVRICAWRLLCHSQAQVGECEAEEEAQEGEADGADAAQVHPKHV